MPCELCKGALDNADATLCNRCWELKTRINANPRLAQKLVALALSQPNPPKPTPPTNDRTKILSAIALFIQGVEAKFAAAGRKNFTTDQPEKLAIRKGKTSGDWVALDTDRSVYCWIRMTDGYTKTLGALKAGDIHRPASFKAPAKHARGNVLEQDYGLHCAGAYGIKYLK